MSEWTDRRLDDRFTGIDRQLDDKASALEVKELRNDVADSKEASKSVQRVLLGFFSALLIVLIAAIVGVVLAL